jgi:HSP20 family molecular chaperone IbpA
VFLKDGRMVNEEMIKAEFKDRTLNINIPKHEELSNKRKIEIE